MCYWVGTKKVREAIMKRKESGNWDELDQLFYDTFIARQDKEFQEHYIARGHAKPVLTTMTKDNGQFTFDNMQWTLPYSYTDKMGKLVKRELLNSKDERVFFQHANQIFSKRCLIPIDGYVEFFHHQGVKYPHYIHPKSDKEIFFAGGIYDYGINKKTGEEIKVFSIITTKPNPYVAKIHNNPEADGPRMLVLIPREKALDFLDETKDKNAIKSFFEPYNQDNMQAYPILKFLLDENKQYFNTSKLLEHCDYPELASALDLN